MINYQHSTSDTVKGAFAVVPTDKICGRGLSKIPDEQHIYETVCHMTNVTLKVTYLRNLNF
jgi:hypothetical protein